MARRRDGRAILCYRKFQVSALRAGLGGARQQVTFLGALLSPVLDWWCCLRGLASADRILFSLSCDLQEFCCFPQRE